MEARAKMHESITIYHMAQVEHKGVNPFTKKNSMEHLGMIMLTRTGYLAFLCNKNVWVILLVSVSILIPLRDNEPLNYF